MKTMKLDLSKDIFNEFTLSNEEMINVRGGSDPVALPNPPPIKI
jgi:hypothetical protein